MSRAKKKKKTKTKKKTKPAPAPLPSAPTKKAVPPKKKAAKARASTKVMREKAVEERRKGLERVMEHPLVADRIAARRQAAAEWLAAEGEAE